MADFSAWSQNGMQTRSSVKNSLPSKSTNDKSLFNQFRQEQKLPQVPSGLQANGPQPYGYLYM